MKIHIPEHGIIEEQEINIDKDVTIIYGYNNSGKTTILNIINNVFFRKSMNRAIRGQEAEMAVYIPTNRVVLGNVITEHTPFQDLEEFLLYQKDVYGDYGLHLTRIRQYLMANKIIYKFICKTVENIFQIDIRNIHMRLSDGIENIINIYLNIIWPIIWDIDIVSLTEKQFQQLVSEKCVYVLIDEIEMFLHVNIQSKLIRSLKEDFRNCSFILTTHSPLLLTRYRNAQVYNIEQGVLLSIDEELYYEDLDNVYEELFSVEELPESINEDINYLGNVIMKQETADMDKIIAIAEYMAKEYPNLRRRYNKIISIAQNIGEGDVKH